MLWNTLPGTIKSAKEYRQFRYRIKNWTECELLTMWGHGIVRNYFIYFFFFSVDDLILSVYPPTDHQAVIEHVCHQILSMKLVSFHLKFFIQGKV